jgi:TMEM175 potassium channel family protein
MAKLRRVRRGVRDIGLIWIEHHGLSTAIERVNRRLLELTLAFLLFVSVIPWPTALAAEHLREGGEAARTVAILFAGAMGLMGVSITLLWRYLTAHPELIAPAARGALPAAARRSLAGSLAYLAAIAAATISACASIAVSAAIALYFALSRTSVPAAVLAAQAGQRSPPAQ